MENSLVIQSFLALGLIIAAAQLGGATARSSGQPRVFGELLAGVILGPSLLNIMSWDVFEDPALLRDSTDQFAELGVLFLMFAVGLEVQLRELLAVGRVALWGGTLGAVLPVMFAAPLLMLFDYSAEMGILAGVTLAATSVSISAQTLLEIGVLRTKEGYGLLATAVVDDVLAILLLSVTVALLGPEADNASVGQLVWIFIRMALFLGGALAVAWLALPRLFNWLYRHRQFAQGIAAFALITALLFGWAADALGGIAAITGAFIAGVGLSQAGEKPRLEIEAAVRHISYAFLVPVFFVNVGLHTDLGQVKAGDLPLAGLLLAVAVITKVAGSGLGARLGGFSTGEAARLGVCMISRGEVGLIIASVELSLNLLDADLFEPLFLVILLTTVLTPPLVRWAFRFQAAPLVRVPAERTKLT